MCFFSACKLGCLNGSTHQPYECPVQPPQDVRPVIPFSPEAGQPGHQNGCGFLVETGRDVVQAARCIRPAGNRKGDLGANVNIGIKYTKLNLEHCVSILIFYCRGKANAEGQVLIVYFVQKHRK